MAIEIDSEDYFIGNNAIGATKKAREQYPKSVFFLARIGHHAAFKIKTLFIDFVERNALIKEMEDMG